MLSFRHSLAGAHMNSEQEKKRTPSWEGKKGETDLGGMRGR